MIRSNTTRTLNTGGDEEHDSDSSGTMCNQAHFVEPYVSRSLEGYERGRFELHLFSCECCRRTVEFELLVERVVGDFAKFAQFSRSWH